MQEHATGLRVSLVTHMSPIAMQEQFFQLWMSNPSSLAYNAGFVAGITGRLEIGALQTAAQLLFDRQEVCQRGNHGMRTTSCRDSWKVCVFLEVSGSL